MARLTAGGEKHKIYKKTNKIGEGKPGDIMVNHPTKDKGKWDTINLTQKAGAKTIKQGIAATKKWQSLQHGKEKKVRILKEVLMLKVLHLIEEKTLVVNLRQL